MDDLLLFEDLAFKAQKLVAKQNMQAEKILLEEESRKLKMLLMEETSFKNFFDQQLDREIDSLEHSLYPFEPSFNYTTAKRSP